MEQINNKLPEALSTLTNTLVNVKQVNRLDTPAWFPIQFQSEYNKTDLEYDPFCLKLFAQVEAVKREKLAPETMRQWFIEFIRRGWTKSILQKRYDALLSTKIFGIEKLEIADWINSVEVYSIEEVQIMIKQRVEAMITKGNFLKDKKVELTDEEKKCVDLWASQDAELKYKREKSEAMDNRRNVRREIFYRRLTGG